MDQRYVIAGLLLAIPTAVLLAVPMYNRMNPQLLGLPFFYWFQAVWLVIAAVLYVTAGLLITSREKDGESA
ncbi:MAG: DUF3311 domain-containing protein [Candidatus Thermoplasmatota archaeon]|nr:DUF3311 domain-containing protein [Candidatus Thermoplasmatota archaeon]